LRFGADFLNITCDRAEKVSFDVKSLWIAATIHPSNSVLPEVLTVIGLNDFQMMLSQMFVAIKREVPLPNPYPLFNISSKRITITTDPTNYKTISIPFP